MNNTFRPRSWKMRSDAAKARAKREENRADIRAVRAAMFHGEEVPADALERLNGPATASLEATADEPVEEANSEVSVVEDEAPEADTPASKRGGRPRKADA